MFGGFRCRRERIEEGDMKKVKGGEWGAYGGEEKDSHRR
jgi:hypothetical protein